MWQLTPYTLPLLFVSIITTAAAYMVWQKRPEPGTTWFSLVILSFAPWSLILAIGVSITTYEPKLLLISTSTMFPIIAAPCWFFFSLTYTGRHEQVTPTRAIAIFTVPALTIPLALTPGIHDLILANPGLDTSGPIRSLTYQWGPVFWVIQIYTLSLLTTGIYYLTLKVLRTRNIYRKISFFLVVGGLTIAAANLFSLTELNPFPHLMLIPLTITLSAIVIIATIYSMKFAHIIPVDSFLSRFGNRFGSVVPLARDFVIEEIENGVIILDENDRIVDINSTAKQILGDKSRVVGRKFQEVENTERILGSLENESGIENWVETPEGERCYETTVTPVTDDRGNNAGRVVLIHDITDRKEREEELDLLKDVMSRFLRHNIRNELNVVNGYAKMIADNVSGYDEEFERIIQTTNKVLERSAKTRTIENVLDNTGNRIEINVMNYVEKAVENVDARYPEAKITLHSPEEAYAKVIGHTATAVENLIENAIEHNDSKSPVVHIEVEITDEWIKIHVKDNGPGIPESEIEVLEEKEETSLRHGSGFGLWLINWITEKSGGELVFDVEDTGTTATMKLEKASQKPNKKQEIKTKA